MPSTPARSSTDAAAVFAHCRSELEANAVPSWLQVLDEIPKTASEKPQERLLLQDFTAGGTHIVASPTGGSAGP